jgi:6-phosphogluconolactonase
MKTFSTFEQFIEFTCIRIVDEANSAIEAKNRFSLVLSGGNTPVSVFNALIEGFKNRVDWSKVDFFWLDERCVPPEHQQSNYGSAHKNLLSKLPSKGKIYRIKGELDPKFAALSYEQEIKDYFGDKEPKFDFILLGMGEDGHIASVFMNNLESGLNSKSVIFTEKKYADYYRVSLTIQLINRANTKFLLISSRAKLNVYQKSGFKYPVHYLKNLEPISLIS